MAETFAAIINAFLLPGEGILTLIGMISPQTEAIMRVDHGAVIYPVIFSLVAWTLFLVICLIVFRMFKRLVTQVIALFWTMVHTIKLALGNLRTRLIWKYRQFFPHKAAQAGSVSQEHFDDMDIAMMASISRSNTGTPRSASELARKYELAPAQIQDRLERLVKNHMVRAVSGSTDGDPFYRLTESGLAYIAMCERQASERLNLVSASVSG